MTLIQLSSTAPLGNKCVLQFQWLTVFYLAHLTHLYSLPGLQQTRVCNPLSTAMAPICQAMDCVEASLQRWPRTVLLPLKALAAIPVKGWDLFPLPLKQCCFCDLLQPTEYNTGDTVPAQGRALRKPDGFCFCSFGKPVTM